MATIFPFQRGETIALALQCLSGNPLAVSSVSASVRRATGITVDSLAPVAASAAVSFVAAAAPAPAYWGVTIAAADTWGLTAGRYALDAELTIAGQIAITETVYLDISEPATAPGAPVTTGFGAAWSNTPSGSASTLVLQWAGPVGGATMATALAGVIGLPGANDATLFAQIALLQQRVAALEAGGVFGAALKITGTPPAGTVGAPYNFTPTVSGGFGTPSFTLTGSLSGTGLSFDPSLGSITGTPTTAGAITGLSISVTDLSGSAFLGPFAMTINAASSSTASNFFLLVLAA